MEKNCKTVHPEKSSKLEIFSDNYNATIRVVKSCYNRENYFRFSHKSWSNVDYACSPFLDLELHNQKT